MLLYIFCKGREGCVLKKGFECFSPPTLSVPRVTVGSNVMCCQFSKDFKNGGQFATPGVWSYYPVRLLLACRVEDLGAS